MFNQKCLQKSAWVWLGRRRKLIKGESPLFESVQYSLCSVQYALCTMHYAVCNIHHAVCKRHNAEIAVYNMHCAICRMRLCGNV